MKVCGRSQDAAHDAIRQFDHVEVDEKTDFLSRKPKIGHQLSFVDRKDSFDCLQFDDDLARHQQVDPEAGIDPALVVDDRHLNLPLEA